jgi:KipI family sensor histidine kinase inhibitor
MRFSPLGDTAILVQVGSSIDDDTQARVRRVVAAIDEAQLPGVTDIVPAYDSVAIFHSGLRPHDGAATAYDLLCARLRTLIESAAAEATSPPDRLIEIPVRYGGADGPDLEHVARHAGISADAVVALHSGAEYRVAVIGFAPGFPYLSGLPPALETPRRASPRTAVPAGSVGIAGRQTGIYPLETPGGWQLIGRTGLRLFDPAASPPTLLRVGDRVRFRVLE